MTFEFINNKQDQKSKLIQWCETQNIPHYLYNDIVYINNQQLIQPLAPFYKHIAITKAEALQIIEQLKGGVIRWPSKKRSRIETDKDWYVITRDMNIAKDELPLMSQRSLHTGFNQCKFRRIEAIEVAREGYRLLQKNASEHLSFDLMTLSNSEDDFIDIVSRDQKYDDFIHYFGAFYDRKLIGFCRCMTFDETEVHLTHIIMDEDYLKFKSKISLVWYIMGYYFDYCNYKTIVSGSRPYGPTSQSGQFFLDELLFEKSYFDLHVVFRRDIDYKMSFMRPFGKLMGKLRSDMKTYINLDRQKTK